ncbi:MAG: response regulator transcription factor [Clostridiales bacterium]|nr:response regulator transcription factor [Clostridiales bacterium]
MYEFLIIEADRQTRSFIGFSLKSQGYDFIEVDTGKEGLDVLRSKKFTCVILDLELSDVDSINYIKEIRLINDSPIIALSKIDDVDEKVKVLDAGTEDYLTKPFNIDELLARIRVIIRHLKKKQVNKQTVYRVADLEVDLENHKVLLEGVEVHFTPIEFNLIALLVQNPGKVLTHRYLLKEVWGSSFESDTQTLRVFMANIRRKLEKKRAKTNYIITEVGVGYRFVEN